MRNDTQQSGFSMIEILIGMTIGLIVILVIMQTMSLFEGQRKSSSGAANMQSNGLAALYSLEQDTRLAGYGLIVNYQGIGDLPCTKINGYGAPAGVFDAIPISLDTSGVSDTITISRMDTTRGGLITGGKIAKISSVIATQADLTAASGIMLDSTPGMFNLAGASETVGFYPPSSVNTSDFSYKVVPTVADTVLISFASGVPAATAKVCTLLKVGGLVSAQSYVAEVTNVAGTPYFGTILLGVSAVSAVVNGVRVADNIASAVIPGGTISAVIPAWTKLSFVATSNVGLNTATAPTFTAYPAGSAVMHNLGPDPTLTRTTFAVNAAGQFTKSVNGNAADPVADNIVSMQAQYGIATAGTQAINCWVDPTANNPASPTCLAGDTANWTPAGLQATPANIKRIKAIRVAIVARNNIREKAKNGVCTATSTAPISWLNGPAINLTANPEWQCYRYKVYQTIIPLHNVILGNI